MNLLFRLFSTRINKEDIGHRFGFSISIKQQKILISFVETVSKKTIIYKCSLLSKKSQSEQQGFINKSR